ncbi:MAG: ribonuclease Y [Ruminococcus bromii]|nr:ribonuclease Y [Lactimicrobium massiliense]MCI6825211.1 ribonuclease Y [Ruminococcus bromii]MCI7211905.1 ribonuclease Y [Ruminococcus bromii]MDD6433524.1 ribonuclease Y [Ruminococcus bromii]MDD6674343.1 ribonuclease Y [Lactimicrobium massiliense]MDY4712076.1 ribonuclease Y [Ruminococcus bromii]
MQLFVAIICIVAALVVGGVVGVFTGIKVRKNTAEKEIGSAEEEAKRIVSEAIKTGEAKKKEAVLEGKDEVHKFRTESEKEISERRKEVQRQERRVQQKEESLDRKLDHMEQREEKVNKKLKEADEKLEEIEALKKSQFEMLEKISGYTAEQAKSYLLSQLENELVHEKSVKIMEYQEQLKEEADDKARNIISLAIQRLAADQVAEATISVVPLPNDEMKGRIIGREGRNIRAIETLTGVDLIIDDTPEAITLSCFEPVRREVARIALEKLISDGRIHPARIEETVEKARREVDATIKREGERAVLEAGVHNIHPEIVKLLGRLRYRTSYGQNVLNHSLEVSYLAGMMASELGLDPTIAKRAGLLHDIGKSIDHEVEGTHIQIGVDIARKYKESDAVIHAIQAHHGDVEAKTIVACLVQAADAISAARPGARRENVENYIKRLQKLEEVASSFDGVDRTFAIQAGREVRVMVKPEVVKDERMVPLAREICKKIEEELEYPGQIKVNIIRESRASDFAK